MLVWLFTSFKSRLVLPFWYQLTQVVLEKRLLNKPSVVVVIVDKFSHRRQPLYMFSLFIVNCLRWEVECLDAIGSTWLNDRKGIWPVKKSTLHIREDFLADPVHWE